jgi:hypothetical protein
VTHAAVSFRGLYSKIDNTIARSVPVYVMKNAVVVTVEVALVQYNIAGVALVQWFEVSRE